MYLYRKLRSGSVKSSALNGTGQTYAETWEIAARALCTYPSTRKTYKTPTAAAITRDSLPRVLAAIYGEINGRKNEKADHQFFQQTSTCHVSPYYIFFNACN